MQQQANEQLMVVMLENMVQQTLPRTFAIRQKLERGEILHKSEVDFFLEVIDKVNHCQRNFLYDAQCKVIFTTVSHLLLNVAHMALGNEQTPAKNA